jgi:hypothetical protein
MELAEFSKFWTNIRVKIGTNGGCLHIKPISVGVGTNHMIINEDVVRVCDPESSRSLISVQETVRRSGQDRQVAIIDTFSLNGIFDEE